MRTKKMLVPFDLNEPNKRINGFLYPDFKKDQVNSFLDIKKEKEWKVGMIVYIGTEISVEDIYNKIIDAGTEVESKDILLEHLEYYLSQISEYRIGDIIGIEPIEKGFELQKLKKPSKKKRKLP